MDYSLGDFIFYTQKLIGNLSDLIFYTPHNGHTYPNPTHRKSHFFLSLIN